MEYTITRKEIKDKLRTFKGFNKNEDYYDSILDYLIGNNDNDFISNERWKDMHNNLMDIVSVIFALLGEKEWNKREDNE